MHDIDLSRGTIQYRDQGSGRPIVLIHGLLVNGRIWDPVVEQLRKSRRWIVPELPLGSHRIPMGEDADLTPTAVAGMIAELISRLELEDVTLVGNDTGGALSQLVVAGHPERLGGLVLTNCDSFEHFPPPSLRPVVAPLKLPGVAACIGQLARSRRVRALFSKMNLTMRPIPDELVRSWVDPLLDPRIRSDLRRFVRGIPATDLVAAARSLRGFDHPALIVWGNRDPYFPFADAQRLAATLPQARLERIDDARTFVQIDAPQRLADLIVGDTSVADGPPATPARAR
jgi:pimeloyl-ACP methyl ester carboxylesterase